MPYPLCYCFCPFCWKYEHFWDLIITFSILVSIYPISRLTSLVQKKKKNYFSPFSTFCNKNLEEEACVGVSAMELPLWILCLLNPLRSWFQTNEKNLVLVNLCFGDLISTYELISLGDISINRIQKEKLFLGCSIWGEWRHHKGVWLYESSGRVLGWDIWQLK